MKSLNKNVFKHNDVLDYMDFDYIAYGNARGVPPNVQCQHGAPECLGNMAEECAKNQTGADPFKYMPYALCLEDGEEITTSSIAKCAKSTGLDADDITSCLTDGRGDALITKAAKDTVDHEYVPYVTFNGKAMNNPDKLLKEVCSYWTGKKPSWCKKDETVCLNEH